MASEKLTASPAGRRVVCVSLAAAATPTCSRIANVVEPRCLAIFGRFWRWLLWVVCGVEKSRDEKTVCKQRIIFTYDGGSRQLAARHLELKVLLQVPFAVNS